VSPETPVIFDVVINSLHPSHDVIVVMEILAVPEGILFICNELPAVVVVIGVGFITYKYTNRNDNNMIYTHKPSKGSQGYNSSCAKAETTVFVW